MSLLVAVLMLALMMALPAEQYVARTLCLMTIAFVVGLDLTALIQLAHHIDSTSVTHAPFTATLHGRI